MKEQKRTHYCGHVSENLIGQTVTVMGWVNKQRDLPNLIFLVLRDRTGLVQIAVDKESEFYAAAKGIRAEFVLAATGTVAARTPENVNKDMPTGVLEIIVQELQVLSESEVPPFHVASENVAIDTRLKYRYIDLRRPEMQRNFEIRHKATQAVRKFLSDEGFLELETPILINSSPEGARDYLVPSRTHPGTFFALPQSPQQMKQVLMISGFDKYFQLARCFRDEDLRADRQPEFTCIDIEMSFANEEGIMELTENLISYVFKHAVNADVPLNFPRLTWHEAMERFGSDKPDTRFAMEICNITDIVNGSDFQVFAGAIEKGGSVRGINAENCASLPRKQIDQLVETAKLHKAKGLAWITLPEDGTIKSTISKFFSDEELRKIAAKFQAKPGDLILLCADENKIVLEALGAVRLDVAKRKEIPLEGFNFLWVTKFPLMEYSPEEQRYFSTTHPFTSPLEDDLPLLETNPGAVRSRSYDLVLNGVELGSGSVRIHRQELQNRMFEFLGFTRERAEENFGYFLEALKYGVPPHCGIGLGLDRIIMQMIGSDALRDVTLFPKVKDASCPLTHAPSQVAAVQLEELGIAISAENNGNG